MTLKLILETFFCDIELYKEPNPFKEDNQPTTKTPKLHNQQTYLQHKPNINVNQITQEPINYN